MQLQDAEHYHRENGHHQDCSNHPVCAHKASLPITRWSILSMGAYGLPCPRTDINGPETGTL